MSSDLVIQAEGVGKSYRLYATPRDRLKQLFATSSHKYYREFAALADVTFDVRRGETVGIIGRNGSGKSTLLQIACGTLQPSAGRITTRGRIAAILELGAGFSPEFSGRENIFLNGYIVGLTQQEIEARLDAICAFADIGDFIEQPIKTYSTGMVVRLAFAVMAHVDAEILVIDEALAVGDARFVQKCMRFLREFKERGTLLFVSHDTSAVSSLCDRVLWLDGGRVKALGPSKQVCELYLENLLEAAQGASRDVDAPRAADRARPARRGASEGPAPRRHPGVRAPHRCRRSSNSIRRRRRSAGAARASPTCASSTRTANGLPGRWAAKPSPSPSMSKPSSPWTARSSAFWCATGWVRTSSATTRSSRRTTSRCKLAAGDAARARFEFDLPLLPPGNYSIAVAVADGHQQDHVQHEWIHDALIFRVETSSIRHSLVGVPMRSIGFDLLERRP